MPEQDREIRLEGATEVTSSSNEAIWNTIVQLRREYEAVSDKVIEGETLEPALTGLKNALDRTPVAYKSEAGIRPLGPTDSALGRLIFRKRASKLKRAA